jgi:branched-chain amino acid transport system ATP-binding protein
MVGEQHRVGLQGVGISVSYAGVPALQGIDVALNRGEILGLIGPNGAGKTTLVNVLTGFASPDEGGVWLDGQALSSVPPHRRAGLGLARTFQGARVFPRLTIAENVSVGLSRSISRREAHRRTEEALELVGLKVSRDVLAGSLPFGDERRLGIARAVVCRPAYLLMDEPAAGLNEQEGEELGKTVREIRDMHDIGILLIEHDMSLIMSLSDRIHVLSFGKTLAIGTPAEIRAHRDVIDAYLGESV